MRLRPLLKKKSNTDITIAQKKWPYIFYIVPRGEKKKTQVEKMHGYQSKEAYNSFACTSFLGISF